MNKYYSDDWGEIVKHAADKLKSKMFVHKALHMWFQNMVELYNTIK